MKYEVLYNTIFRVPLKKAVELVDTYMKEVGFNNFAEQQKILDLMSHKDMAIKQIRDEIFEEATIALLFMSKDKGPLSQVAFEGIKRFPMVVWIETLGYLDSVDIMGVLDNFYTDLPSSVLETCILNLSEEDQLTAVDKYLSHITKSGELFENFYYAVCPKAREKLKALLPESLPDDILLELKDLDEREIKDRLLQEKDRLEKVSPDELVEFILLKTNEPLLLNAFLKMFVASISKSSPPYFKMLISRFKYLRDYEGFSDNLKKEYGILSDMELFSLFKSKFHEIGLEDTLTLFDKVKNYASNPFTVDIVLELIDIAYADADIAKYLNDETIIEIINRFVEKCNTKEYTVDDLAALVSALNKYGKTKLVFDDFIEAIIACGQLLKSGRITDKHPLFLELRNKFTEDLIGRAQKDGTYLESISLNGIFYRLAKGTLPFANVYMIKTYRGLIYLTKCGLLIDNPDYVTTFLTDEQLAKLNIAPVIRWKHNVVRTNTNADNLSFMERMGLQLLCYFGRDKGKYLLESDMQGNRMENLFDGLNYASIEIDDQGNPVVNKEALDYLFGKGPIINPKSIINRIIKAELPDFERHFTDFCNFYDTVKEACNGVLSIKRVVSFFEDEPLAIELKPDEIEFKRDLKEMGTINPDLLNEAVQLCKDARNRRYSSIPKVEGKLGDFTYKVLDLKDPLAVAVGYLSHCCFVVRGISYSSLKHSMQSVNGRTFVVYYKGGFLTQSWVWRNGDVICFDSVEAGSSSHGMYADDIKLVDVYKMAAQQMLYASESAEDEIQKAKVVTIGKSDYILEGLSPLEGNVPRPLENNVYVSDSSSQAILAGAMPENPRYGVVGHRYTDPRRSPIYINDVEHADIDSLDEIMADINSLKYQLYKDDSQIDFANYAKIISGDGWYVMVRKDGTAEGGALQGDDEITEEFTQCISKYQTSSKKDLARELTPLTTRERKR